MNRAFEIRRCNIKIIKEGKATIVVTCNNNNNNNNGLENIRFFNFLLRIKFGKSRIIIRFDSFESRWCAQPFEIPMMKAPGYHFELRSCVRLYYCPWQWQIVITPITRTRVTYHFRTRSTLLKNLETHPHYTYNCSRFTRYKIIRRHFLNFSIQLNEYVIQAVLKC